MTKRVLRAATIFTVLLFPAFGGAALAGPEWCDDGSPPPNDWRFRKTGAPSDVSRKAWIRSTTGDFDLRIGLNTLQGGVATGMWNAVGRAPSQEEIEGRRDRHDDD